MGRISTTCHASTTSVSGFVCPVLVSACLLVVSGRSPWSPGASSAFMHSSSHSESVTLSATSDLVSAQSFELSEEPSSSLGRISSSFWLSQVL
ncbi:hypothetical protein EDC04DRAFT_2732911 [Pisolithus marmoratus]|nr:hypothetical protein EDC04DRAFT_2732911 [Pisolithus marmoratus]